ncbi:MAG TPA: GLPGLI family protein [Phnomibacter sp.]|nr:GLPGLI family protein [Phnomibacter sp.]
MKASNRYLKYWAAAMLLFIAGAVHAQSRFIRQGKIEYEKKVNMHKMIEDNSWTREFKDKMPVYRTTYYDMVFNDSVSVYKAGKEAVDDKWKNMWMSGGGEENVMYSNFNTGSNTAFKQVFEKKFLLQDSMVHIEWRITDETRDIAGFECRKAVGKLYDSLYVVAFYTDQITIPSGPEIYNGLPGTILGLAFPRFYTTWFATKVELIEPKPTELVAPSSKTKKVTRKEMMDQVKEVFASEGGSSEERQKYFWNTVL